MSKDSALPKSFFEYAQNSRDDSSGAEEAQTFGTPEPDSHKRNRDHRNSSSPTSPTMTHRPNSSTHQDIDEGHRNKRRQTDKNNFFANTSSDEVGDQRMESGIVPAADRGRATSSLVSDDSDGEPYVPPRSMSSGAEEEPEEPLFTTAASPNPTDQRRAKTDTAAIGPSRAKTVVPDYSRARHTASFKPTPGPARSNTVAPRASMMQPEFLIGEPDPANARPYPMPPARSDIPDKATKLDASSPVEDVRTMSPLLDDDLAEKQRSEFSEVYSKLLKGHTAQTTFLNDLHNAHERSLKRTQNLASRRKMRIEQLDRENAALRRQLQTGTTSNSPSMDYERKLSTAAQTITMLTADLSAWEAKYATSQSALRSITDDATTFERKYNAAAASATDVQNKLRDVERQLEDSKAGIRNGTKQLKQLQKVLRKVDRVIVHRVKELVTLSAEWDRKGGADERLRARVAEEMMELVNAWRRFEGEYDEGVAGEAVDAV